MHSDKLLRLADYLETQVEPERFDMHYWATQGFKEKTCGSTACAFGFATMIPEFAAEGLHLVENDAGIYVSYKGCDYQVGASFFDITIDAHEWLFECNLFRDRLEVARDIRALVANNGKSPDDNGLT